MSKKGKGWSHHFEYDRRKSLYVLRGDDNRFGFPEYLTLRKPDNKEYGQEYILIATDRTGLLTEGKFLDILKVEGLEGDGADKIYSGLTNPKDERPRGDGVLLHVNRGVRIVTFTIPNRPLDRSIITKVYPKFRTIVWYKSNFEDSYNGN